MNRREVQVQPSQNPLCLKARAHTLNRIDMHLKGLGDSFVNLTAVGGQQNLRSFHFPY